ncbi:hypothetical protein ACJX0J_036618, partial [Zea mays]
YTHAIVGSYITSHYHKIGCFLVQLPYSLLQLALENIFIPIIMHPSLLLGYLSCRTKYGTKSGLSGQKHNLPYASASVKTADFLKKKTEYGIALNKEVRFTTQQDITNKLRIIQNKCEDVYWRRKITCTCNIVRKKKVMKILGRQGVFLVLPPIISLKWVVFYYCVFQV